jgi:hypothetical protein
MDGTEAHIEYHATSSSPYYNWSQIVTQSSGRMHLRTDTGSDGVSSRKNYTTEIVYTTGNVQTFWLNLVSASSVHPAVWVDSSIFD